MLTCGGTRKNVPIAKGGKGEECAEVKTASACWERGEGWEAPYRGENLRFLFSRRLEVMGEEYVRALPNWDNKNHLTASQKIIISKVFTFLQVSDFLPGLLLGKNR